MLFLLKVTPNENKQNACKTLDEFWALFVEFENLLEIWETKKYVEIKPSINNRECLKDYHLSFIKTNQRLLNVNFLIQLDNFIVSNEIKTNKWSYANRSKEHEIQCQW